MINFDEFCQGEEILDIVNFWNSSRPYFSECFRHTVPSWSTGTLIFLIAPFHINYLIRRHERGKQVFTISWNTYNISRLAFLLLAIVANCGGLAYDTYNLFYPQTFKTPSHAQITSSAINILSYSLFAFVLILHRKHGLLTSSFTSLVTLVGAIVALPVLYTYSVFYHNNTVLPDFFKTGLVHWSSVNLVVDCVHHCAIVVVFIFTLFSDTPDQEDGSEASLNNGLSSSTPLLRKGQAQVNSSQTSKQPVNPMIRASFFSLISFSFVFKLLSQGKRKPLNFSDLWSLRSQETNAVVQKKWEQRYMRNKSVLLTMISSNMFVLGGFLKLSFDVLKFVKPFILKIFLGLFENQESFPMWNGFFIGAMFFIVSNLQALCLNNYWLVMGILANRIKSALTSSIYKKSLVLSNEARTKTTSGEITNLLSVDTQRITSFFPDSHQLWSCPLQMIAALFFLYLELGIAILAGVAVLLFLIPLNAFISNYQQNKEKHQMERKDERMKIINEVLNGIKVIKLYGWEIPFIQRITSVRWEEIKYLRAIANMNAVNSFVWSCAPFAVSFSTFAVYVSISDENILTAQKAFVSLALFEGLRFPMAEMSSIVTNFATRLISIRRLDRFFNDSSEVTDYIDRSGCLPDNQEIALRNASFTWNCREPELRNIHLNIKKGSLVAIVGNVASGKSSLLNALLGNMKILAGSVAMDQDAKIAYVSQQAWIQNASLKDNVLFGSQYLPKIYRKIINICALKADIRSLPGGDQTEIGEKGINLSGGQKQRVAMARACYSDANLFLMDDPLSAVDSHVAKHIFTHVLSNATGYLKDRTRVLVTNSISFLPEFDQIIVLSNGRISNIGTYQELLKNENEFSEFLQEHSKTVQTPDADTISVSSKHRLIRTLSTDSNHELEIVGDQLIEEERAEIGNVKYSIYLQYIRTFTFFWFFCMIVGYSLMQLFQVGTGLWLAVWAQNSPSLSNETSVEFHINTTEESVPGQQSTLNTSNSSHSQMYYLQIYGLIGGFQGLFSVVSMVSLVNGGMRTAIEFHKRLLIGVLRSPMSFFDTTPIGRILNRFSKDIESIDSEITFIIDGYIFCLLHVISTLTVIIFKLPIFTVFVVPLFLVYYFVSGYFVSSSRQLQRLESISKSPIFSHFGETLSGISTIRAFGVTNRFTDETSKKTDMHIRCALPRSIINRWLSFRLEILGSSILFLTTVLLVIYRDYFGNYPGLIGLLTTYSMYVTDNLNWMTRLSAEMETNIVSVERIQEYSDNQTEKEWKRTQNVKPTLLSCWPQGAIKFEDYSLCYREGLELVLNRLNIEIFPGEKIGIVGRTGAGKSSLTLALFRIVEPASGRILLDDVDITQIGLHELRSKLSIIPQDPVLFSGTIRSNLDPFSAYDDRTLWKALEHSHLRDYVSSLDAGLEYTVAENGENLSVGQRQLICLGRALLRNTKILVLDEATASVDLETDALIQNTIKEEFHGCTILTIAHRLHTILDYDRVIVMDRGQVIEFDSPTTLLSNVNSQFYSLAKDAKIV